VLKYQTPWISAIFIAFGYIIHIPAEFAVLYSRLHLIGASRRTLHLILAGMVVEVSLITFPSCILVTGALATAAPKFVMAFFYFQRLEVCVYAAFEIVVSGVYIYHVRLMWDMDGIEARKSVLKRLLYMSILIIFLDLSNITVEFAGKNAVRSSLLVCLLSNSNLFSCPLKSPDEAFIFGFRLKVEFWILNLLTDLSQESQRSSMVQFGNPATI
jgi:hypothetical protein